MKRKLIFGFGIASYLIFLVTFLYTIGFVGNLIVPKSIDSGGDAITAGALLVNLGLITLFGVQHSVMARPAFKRWWTSIIPKAAERSVYVLMASLTLLLIFALWQPMAATVWDVQPTWARALLWGLFALGWIMVFASARMINSAHLFGTQQVKEYLHGKPQSPPEFQTPALYRYVRHPLMLSFLIAFWATPTMTVGHLVFAAAMTLYIFIGVHFEERALVRRFGVRYREYRVRVPMLVPRLRAEPQLQPQIDRAAARSRERATARR